MAMSKEGILSKVNKGAFICLDENKRKPTKASHNKCNDWPFRFEKQRKDSMTRSDEEIMIKGAEKIWS
jgi:hypothetical protein